MVYFKFQNNCWFQEYHSGFVGVFLMVFNNFSIFIPKLLTMLKREINREELFIFQRMVDGDQRAFRFFFDKYYTDLCRFIYLYTNDAEMAEELAQEIYVYLWDNRNKITIHSSVKSYLYSASKNKSLNYIRNEKIKNRVLENYKEQQTDTRQPEEYYLDTSQLQEILKKSIASLPERCREIFLLSREKNLSHKEIAEKLAISPKSVENQIGIALKKLREQLRPYRDKIFILFFLFLFS